MTFGTDRSRFTDMDFGGKRFVVYGVYGQMVLKKVDIN